MPWPRLLLNNGTEMPSLAYGHIFWVDQETIAPDVQMAIETGIVHLDTAQGYYDEDKFALGIHRSGKQRSDLYITSKWSRRDTEIEISCKNSLKQLNIEQLDLYLIHDRDLCGNDIKGHWEQMELVQKLGYTVSIGVSNFELHDLKTLVSGCKVVPAVNQIQIDPHSFAEMGPLVEFCRENNILLEAFTSLELLRTDPEGAVARTVTKIGVAKSLTPDQVLMAWSKSKGLAVVTSSSKRERIRGYIAAGDVELSEQDIREIDHAGKRGQALESFWGFFCLGRNRKTGLTQLPHKY